jgi:hypothetical protein
MAVHLAQDIFAPADEEVRLGLHAVPVDQKAAPDGHLCGGGRENLHSSSNSPCRPALSSRPARNNVCSNGAGPLSPPLAHPHPPGTNARPRSARPRGDATQRWSAAAATGSTCWGIPCQWPRSGGLAGPGVAAAPRRSAGSTPPPRGRSDRSGCTGHLPAVGFRAHPFLPKTPRSATVPSKRSGFGLTHPGRRSPAPPPTSRVGPASGR